MKRTIIFFSFICLSFLLSSCVDDAANESVGEVQGLKPLYAAGDDWKTVTVVSSREIVQLGKIYYKDNIIYVNELNRGIHIIDNTIPTNPQTIKFINVPGSKDISIKGNFLYTDNVSDLLVLDISDFNNITVVNRIPNIYPNIEQLYPEFHTGYFECVDASKGTVIAWESATLNNPECRR